MQDILICKPKVEFFKSDKQNQRYWYLSITSMRGNNTDKETTLTSLPNSMNVISEIVLHEFKISYMKPIHTGQMSYMIQKVFVYTARVYTFITIITETIKSK